MITKHEIRTYKDTGITAGHVLASVFAVALEGRIICWSFSLENGTGGRSFTFAVIRSLGIALVSRAEVA